MPKNAQTITIALISHPSKVMLKILQARLQQYVNWELPDVQVGFIKGRGTRDQIANICGIIALVAQMVKNQSAMWEAWVRSLGWEDPLKEGMPTHSSILAWRIPMDRGAWRAAVHGVYANSQIQLTTKHSCMLGHRKSKRIPQNLLLLHWLQ